MLGRALPLLFGILFLSVSSLTLVPYRNVYAQAQASDGKITGTILDNQTGEKLIGVSVAVEGTKKGARTNVDGIFTVTLTAGSYDLRVSAVGYKTKILQDVNVIPGDVKSVDVTLEAV